MRIVGITGDDDGSVSSGKSEVARALESQRGMVAIGLADPIKRFAAETYGFTREQLWGPSAARNAPDMRWPLPGDEAKRARAMHELGVSSGDRGLTEHYGPIGWLTPRRACQMIGTEGGRDIHPDTWVRTLWNAVESVMRRGNGYSPWGGVAPRLHGSPWAERSDVVVPDVRHANEADAIRAMGGMVLGVHRPGAKRLQGDAGAHRSEHGLRGVQRDAEIVNDGTLEQLSQRALSAVDAFFESLTAGEVTK